MALFIDNQEMLNLSIDGVAIDNVNIDGVTVAQKPTITTQPIATTIDDTQTATLSVVADGLGSTLSYQWYMDDTAISGATAASYTFTPSTTGTYSFYCRVSGFGGYTQSDAVSVVVEASGSHHVLTVGQESEYNYILCGFAVNSDDSRVGVMNPELTDTGDNCTYLGGTKYDIAGNEIYFGGLTLKGDIKAGSVIVNIEGFGEVQGELTYNESYHLPGEYGVIFDKNTSSSLFNYLFSLIDANLNVIIQYKPS